MEENMQNQQNNYTAQQPVYMERPSQPSSVGSWVVTILLTCIPIVNIVMLFVWAFGNTEDVSKKNWAKAQLVWVLIAVVLVVFCTAVLGVSLLSMLY